ncbi:dihydrofolate reductase family protein [Actinomadura citrea]|uniref:Dihydrofolate reductase n=1 Tax=Actinomadura citrea TaxID=46158 RepID=A0A7Y9KA79_9ACTN|nr:dihydrofolate reductase family protein [Actinomadura citrea]NYE09861.1 dihydrofolate reductase [Actinomadura citrea]GGT63899.1 deaminase [Actinomadura citrea]
MTKVITSASMSLDGYISGPGESGFEHLFGWHRTGDVEVATARPDMAFKVTPQTGEHLRRLVDGTGALVVGRKLFDLTQGWGGSHPFGGPVFVVTHTAPDAWPHQGFTFVTDGVESAVRQAAEVAGGKAVGVAAGDMARQALAAGLIDEFWVDLVPVLLGGGTPFFNAVTDVPLVLDDPDVVQGRGVTHLVYRLHSRA